MPNPKISVIVPVYNSQKYLRHCLQSLAEQTLPDIEVLMVNNNTPDGSQQIMDEFAARDPRFKSFFRKDGMAGGARNEGLKHARGEYMAFVDSDDCVYPRFCQILYQTAKEQRADIVQCAHTEFTRNAPPVPPERGRLEQTLFSPPARPLDFLRTGQHLAVPWAKLWKRELLERHALRFPQGRPHEDVAFVSVAFALAKRFARISHPLYCYRITPNSLSKRNPNRFAQSMYENFAFMRQKLKEENLYDALKESYEFHLLEILIGGERNGNGALKKLPRRDLQAFLSLCAEFYLALPPDLFARRAAPFRLKYTLFLKTLRSGRPVPLQRPLVNLFTFFYGLLKPQAR